MGQYLKSASPWDHNTWNQHPVTRNYKRSWSICEMGTTWIQRPNPWLQRQHWYNTWYPYKCQSQHLKSSSEGTRHWVNIWNPHHKMYQSSAEYNKLPPKDTKSSQRKIYVTYHATSCLVSIWSHHLLWKPHAASTSTCNKLSIIVI